MGWDEKNNKYSHVDTDVLADLLANPSEWEIISLFRNLSDSQRAKILDYAYYIKDKREN